MAERDATAGWVREWQAMQEQFLSSWRDAMRDSGAAKGIPLHEGLDLWTRLASGQAGHDEVTERMLASARQVVALMQQSLEAAGAAGRAAGSGDAESWRRAMAETFGALDLGRNPVLDALRSATGTGAESFEQMAAQAREAIGAFAAPMRGWLSAPTFGLAREAQERQQRLARALAEQAEAERGYQALLLKASQLALSKFEGKLAERDAPGRQVRSGRELYDLWIDAAEEGYAEVAMSPEFRSAYAAMVGAQMKVRQGIQKEVELLSGQFGMPTRSELDSAHRRIADLTRRLVALEERAGTGGDPLRRPSDPASSAAATAAPSGSGSAGTAVPRALKASASTKIKTKTKTKTRPRTKAEASATKAPAPAKGSFAERLAASRAASGQPARRGKGAKA
jgi:class III poly(R)-hydroxyalkanoic acid synthase PhaE subunit